MFDENVDYKKMYLKMFNAAEAAINFLMSQRGESTEIAAAIDVLISAQLECEEIYITAEK